MDTWRQRTAEQWVGSLSEGEPAPRDSVPNLAAIALLSSQIQAEHARHGQARRRRRIALALGSSALAVAAAVLLWWKAQRPSATPAVAELRAFDRAVTLESDSGRARPNAGKLLSTGDALLTGSGASALVSLADGGTLNLGAFSELRLVTATSSKRLTAVRLARGSVEVELPKRAPGERFSISTPDSTVTVVGTKFVVRVAETGSAPVTCVTVTHGRVQVQGPLREALLGPGERWVSGDDLAVCDGNAPGARTVEPSGAAPAPAPAASTRPDASVQPAPPVASGSHRKSGTLAEENRLFLEMVRARRAGHTAEARALQRRFLSRYPESALLEQVREEQRRTP